MTLYKVIGGALVAFLVGAVALVRWRRELRIRERNGVHPLLLLGIVFVIPGLPNLIMDGEESVFLTMGIIFTLAGIIAQFLTRTPQDSVARKRSLIGSLIGFSVGAAAGAALYLVFGWPLILMILGFGALGLLAGMFVERFYQSRIQA